MEEVTPTSNTLQVEHTEISLKNQVYATRIAQGLIDGKTYTQIAEDLQISRPTLYAIMSKTEVQELMTREVRELETTLQHWITELHSSDNSANKRHAITELGKIVKHVQDKLYPSLFRTETVNINVDLDRLQTQQHIITETLNRMPPTIRNKFWDIYNQVTTEYKTPEYKTTT